LVLLSLLLIDIAQTFNQPIGVAGQIRAMFSIIGLVSALLMGVWSVKYNHKSLLLIGIAFLSISALGCAVSFTFTMLLVAFSLSGLGLNMIEPMLFTLVAKYLPIERRAQAISWVLSGVAIAPIVGAPIIGIIAEVGGWRWGFFAFILPITLISLLLIMKVIPNPTQSSNSSKNAVHYVEGFRIIFRNISSTACLLGTALGMATYQVLSFYGSSFFREHFLVSIGTASLIYSSFSLCFILGLQICGRMVNKIGRRILTIVTAVITGVLTILFMNAPHLWVALILMFLNSLFFGMWFSAISNLTLEQIPDARGTMMSLNSAAWSGGAAFGSGMGGLLLLYFDYSLLGISLGIMCLVTAIIIFLLVKDPSHAGSANDEEDSFIEYKES